MEELISLENVLLAVAWAAVGGIALVPLVWFIRDLKPQDGPRIVSKHWSFPVPETPITLLSPERRYELWRKELTAWTDEDGTQVGLDALLERWRGVPHEKPAAPAPGWGAGNLSAPPPLPVDGRTAAVTGIAIGDKFNYVASTKDDLDRIMSGGDGAMLRFFERNRKRLERQFREPFAGAEKAGQSLTLNDLKFKAFTVNCAGSPPKTFRNGEWVRMTSGRGVAAFGPDNLFKISDSLDSNSGVRLIGRDGGVAAGWHEIEPALPRTGEWWEKDSSCPKHDWHIGALPNGNQVVGPYLVQEGDGTVNEHWISACKCGCLTPVNFGRGEEAKS